jgi:hypothetical protein
VPHYTEPVAVQRLANGCSIHLPRRGQRRLEGQIDKAEPHSGDPLDLMQYVARRVVHRAYEHVRLPAGGVKPGSTVEEIGPPAGHIGTAGSRREPQAESLPDRLGYILCPIGG